MSNVTPEQVLDALNQGNLAVHKHAEGRNWRRVFTLLLFVLFIAALLSAFFVGSNVYVGLSQERNQTNESRLGVSLLDSIVRSSDGFDGVAVGEGPEGDALVLVERLRGGTYEMRIFKQNGTIYEQYALANDPYDATKATAIVESEVFDFWYDNGLLTLMTDYGHAEIALHSIGGES